MMKCNPRVPNGMWMSQLHLSHSQLFYRMKMLSKQPPKMHLVNPGIPTYNTESCQKLHRVAKNFACWHLGPKVGTGVQNEFPGPLGSESRKSPKRS